MTLIHANDSTCRLNIFFVNVHKRYVFPRSNDCVLSDTALHFFLQKKNCHLEVLSLYLNGSKRLSNNSDLVCCVFSDVNYLVMFSLFIRCNEIKITT